MKSIKGIIFCSIFALAAYFTCKCGFCQSINLNSLTLAIIAGMIIGNVFNKFIPAEFREGITFSAKRLLRLAIILYGFRITFQQIFANVVICQQLALETALKLKKNVDHPRGLHKVVVDKNI